jgi:hypothetical protein
VSVSKRFPGPREAAAHAALRPDPLLLEQAVSSPDSRLRDRLRSKTTTQMARQRGKRSGPGTRR